MSAIAERLLPWFDLHGRKHLPWQQDVDGYRVWLSEIMLQQTQVATVVGYFERFVASFPDANALADAELDAVLQHWAGLGYYARARNLHRAAIQVRDQHDGRFPDQLDDLLALPGVGRSTAGAILSLAFGQRAPILDGNVKRVLARLYRVEGWPGRSATLKQLWQLADEQTPTGRCGAYNQAMMDLGATLCRRANPDCAVCPLTDICQARSHGDQADFPRSKPKKPRPLKKTWMILCRAGDSVLMQRRPPVGIWGGLYSLPELADLDQLEAWQQNHLGRTASPQVVEENRLLHRFTHFDLEIALVGLELTEVPARDLVAEDAGYAWVPTGRVADCATPTPVNRILREEL
jgi:A/G-specific adenine glycosylase